MACCIQLFNDTTKSQRNNIKAPRVMPAGALVLANLVNDLVAVFFGLALELYKLAITGRRQQTDLGVGE